MYKLFVIKDNIIFTEHFNKKHRAIIKAENLTEIIDRENFNQAVEVWRKDRNGQYRQKGLPVWCSNQSKFYKEINNG